jgi:SAM-dependent methyltransferase
MAATISRIADALPQRLKDALPDTVKDASFTALHRGVVAWQLLRHRGSEFVTGYLDGLRGIEIGAASHNRFHLDAINVDRYAGDDTVYKHQERRLAKSTAAVDVVAPGDDLPFEDNSYDFVFSSHVIEHFPDPIKALYEWVRVARRYVVVIAPHRDRTFDADRPLTTVEELARRHRTDFASEEDRHWTVWTCESFLEMCRAAGLRVIDHQDPDDKVGNGFTVVIDAAGCVRQLRG